MSPEIYPLAFKPDLPEAAQRWNAYYAGEIIDRPIVCITAPRDRARPTEHRVTYHELVYGDMELMLDRVLEAAANTYYGGEAIPRVLPQLRPRRDRGVLRRGAAVERGLWRHQLVRTVCGPLGGGAAAAPPGGRPALAASAGAVPPRGRSARREDADQLP